MLKRTAALSIAWICALSCLPNRHRAQAPQSPAPKVVDVMASTTFTEHGAPGASAHTLVWTRNEEGQSTTYELAADGSVVREDRGVSVASTHGPMHLATEQVAVPTSSCTFDDDGGDTVTTFAAEPGHRTVARLVADDGFVRELVPAPPTSVGAAGKVAFAQYEHGVTIVGQVGSLVFVREDVYEYACGAHGAGFSSAFIFDIETGARVAPESFMPPPGQAAEALRERVASAFLPAVEDADAVSVNQGNSEPSAVEIVPSFGVDARLGLDVRYARAASYADSSGDWSSYFEAKLVRSPSTPAALVAYADAPSVVRSFAATRTPGESVGGWSVVPSERIPSR